MIRIILLTVILVFPSLAAEPDWEKILQPDALRGKQGPASIEQFRELFADPPAEYRTAPLWVWNDQLEWPRLEEMLREYKDLGFGGAFVHPRPGLMTEYLSEEWFDLWKRSLDLSKKLGLKLHIYDENSYPAGFSGGHVPAIDPATAGKVLVYEWHESASDLPWTRDDVAAIFAVNRNSNGTPVSFDALQPGDSLPAEHSALVTRIEQVNAEVWTAGFPYVDITNPRTTELFIETTYEPYKRNLGDEFGKSILWAFNDEPQLPRKGRLGLPMSFRTLAEFQKRKGYDLAEHLPSLYWDTGDFRRVRFDYWELIHALATEAYFEPLFTWCDRNQLFFTGHWMEHEWPNPWLLPSDMAFYAFEHTPGIDLLGFQAFELEESGVEPHILFTIKQAASAANQLNRPRVLSETYGGGGWRYTLEQMKRVGDWQAVHGVNLVNQHLSHATTRGARKRDWPQSFSNVSAWWPYYRVHADHAARLSLAATAGIPRNRVLLLNPTTSGYLHARRSQSMNPQLEELKAEHGSLVQFLADNQVDYDLGDEYIMDWLGSVSEGKLKVGIQSYSVVIWPQNMSNVRSRTVELLGQFVAAGGTVVALGEPAQYIDGRPGAVDAGNWTDAPTHDAALTAIRSVAPPRFTLDRPMPAGVGFMERFLEDGQRLLIVNNAGQAAVEAIATVPGSSAETWDTVTGRFHPLRVTAQSNGKVSFRLNLPPAGTLLLTVRDDGTSQPESPAPETITQLLARDWQVSSEAPNVLVLDFCDLDVNGKRMEDALVMTAAKRAYREHGFDHDPWERAVQFRTNLLDGNTFTDTSGFTASFRFNVADADAIKDLELAVESPELYTIKVNGHAIDFAGAVHWLDPHLLRASIASAAVVGANTVEITGKPFDVRMELEAIYLRGSFNLLPAAKGFELTAPAKLSLGAWSKQGRPFDTATVVYSTRTEIPQGATTLRVSLGRWNGSLAELVVDGKQSAILGWPPYTADVPITAGSHEIAIRVVGTPRNIYGPFHDPRPVGRRILSPNHWTRFANIHQPPGSEYQVEPYGLLAPPTLAIIK